MLVLTTGMVSAAAPVEVVGLFRDRAVVRAPGGEVLLKVGETKQGVTLVAADATGATVDYEGQRYQLSLSNRVAGNYQAVEQLRVAINADRMGQYHVRGAIDGRYTDFLVDTGASVVALSSQLADTMNVDYRAGKPGGVTTAQGRSDAYFVVLDKVTVGSITARNVNAAVIEGEFPLVPLLGMSFLNQVSMQESAGVLTLTQRP